MRRDTKSTMYFRFACIEASFQMLFCSTPMCKTCWVRFLFKPE